MTIPSWLTTSTTSPLPPALANPIVSDAVVYIYALIDPDTNAVRYIGKSIRPAERLSNHINEPPSNCHRSHWIQSLKARGLKPSLLILETIEGSWPWQESERFWIAFGREQGWPLTNNTDGGDGVEGLPAETRARMAAVWTGRKHRPETIEKLKAARRNYITSDETREKMRAAMRGRKIAWIDKIAAANRKLSPEQEEEIRRRLADGERVADLAHEFGMHRTSITKVKKGTYRGKH